jgi:Ser/Thr protein kinase RdoA (MazF antagonist)
MVTGPAVQDLWLLIPGRDETANETRKLLLEGYESLREFNREELRLIEPLRALRFIHYTAWLARRWDDPAFSRAFPYFNSPRYWEEETRDLESELLIIQNSILS